MDDTASDVQPAVFVMESGSLGAEPTLCLLREGLQAIAGAGQKSDSRTSAEPPATVLWARKHWFPNENCH